jgi:hypothetical protein
MLIAKARLRLIELFYGPKRLSLIIVAAVELGLSSMPGYKASAAPPAIPSEFILRVKALADSGQLTEPEKVGRLLHLNLIFNRHFSSTASERDCAPPGDKNRSQEEDIYAAEGLKLAPAVGEPNFSYIRSEITWCSGLHASNPTVSARIQFGDLDRFVCISEDDLNRHFPRWRKNPGRAPTTTEVS